VRMSSLVTYVSVSVPSASFASRGLPQAASSSARVAPFQRCSDCSWRASIAAREAQPASMETAMAATSACRAVDGR